MSVRFLFVAGVFNVVIWPRFAKAIVDDDRAWAGEHWNSAPTNFFWVHALLISAAVVLAVGILAVAWKAHRSLASSR